MNFKRLKIESVFWMWSVCNIILTAQTFSVSDREHPPYLFTPEASSGLQQVAVVYNINEALLSFASPSSNHHLWYSYTQNAAERTVLRSTQTGNSSSPESALIGNSGYIVKDGDREYYLWLVDYSLSPSNFQKIEVDEPASHCTQLTLRIDMKAPAIYYYTINGLRKTLSREYTLGYKTLEYNETNGTFIPAEIEKSYQGEQTVLTISPPYTDTYFTWSGDQLSKHFNLPSEIKSESYTAKAVMLHTEVTKDDTTRVTGVLEASAPLTLKLQALGNEPPTQFYQWEYSDTPDFSHLVATYPDKETSIAFEESGTFYLRCRASNNDNSCETESEIYTIIVSESYLRVPNVFSPEPADGINDLFQPQCKSIIRFEAHIFNKWGVQLYQWNDPNGNWDGKYNGRYVPPGPYYYVIQATGSDGKQYNLKGDINIINGNGTTSLEK